MDLSHKLKNVAAVVTGKGPIQDKSTGRLPIKPIIYSMQIEADVNNRYAKTLITSKVKNPAKRACETTFSVILPENAFISEFEMEIEGKVYKAYVKEKEEAKQVYQQAVLRGQSAAHVELSARDSKTFTVSVNIEPKSKTIFRLTYEELLIRQVGTYELVINIHPGQIVDDLGVQVNINESRPLTFIKTPSLRTGNEIKKHDENLNPSSQIETTDPNSAVVKFKPDAKQQQNFAKYLGNDVKNGIAGQFIVQYDVERDSRGGEILVRDGYFVHFFAPSELEPLPKHVVFVLDYSGSMMGRKIDQLIDAMDNILSELKPQDLLSIVRFSDSASVWNTAENNFLSINVGWQAQYGNLEPLLRETYVPVPAEVTKESIEKAKEILKDKSGMGSTNIIAGLEIGLFLIKRTQESVSNKHQPMIIFLTDGFPNVGMNSGDMITDTVTKLNSGSNKAAIFSLSFGDGADKNFLRKLSSRNLGFSRHIYEASDASLQLQDFYSKISSPLLRDITFKYVDAVSDVTKIHHPIFFKGSEIVVAGRTTSKMDILVNVLGTCFQKCLTFDAPSSEPVTSLERLWAYLTVKLILEEKETASNAAELTKKALDLALKYSFVTSVSSLVVVKPDQKDAQEMEEDKNKMSFLDSGPRFLRGGGPASGLFGASPMTFGSPTPSSMMMQDLCYQLPAAPMAQQCSAFGFGTASSFGSQSTSLFSGGSRAPPLLPTQNLFGSPSATDQVQSFKFGMPQDVFTGGIRGNMGALDSSRKFKKMKKKSQNGEDCIDNSSTNSQISSVQTPSYNLETMAQTISFLKTENIPEDLLKEKIKETFKYRRDKGCDPEVFPIFLNSKELISFEFSLMYPRGKSLVDDFPNYVDKILDLYNAKFTNPSNEVKGDVDGWDKTVRSIFALIDLLLSPSEASSSVAEFLIRFQKSDLPVETILQERKSNQPFILATGANKSKIESHHIVLGQKIIPVSLVCENDTFLSAFDVLFKIHFVFGIQHDAKLKHFWEFIQGVFYDIDVEFTPEMLELRNQLGVHCLHNTRTTKELVSKLGC